MSQPTGTYYSLLGISPEASPEEIEAAYARQRERYNPERVVDLDPEVRQVAVTRSAELQRAYTILADETRRRQYDASLRGVESPKAAEARGLTPRERTFAAVGALVALLLVGGIWVLTGRDVAPASQAMGEVNRPAPGFETPTLAGDSLRLDDFRGQVVLLNFWATWCEPCKRELPALEAAHQQYADQGLAVIGVNLTDDELAQGNDQAEIKAFLDQFGVTYPVAMDMQGDVTNAYRVFPLPTSFFIDGTGRIRYVHIGELTLNDVTARFNELRQEASRAGAQQ